MEPVPAASFWPCVLPPFILPPPVTQPIPHTLLSPTEFSSGWFQNLYLLSIQYRTPSPSLHILSTGSISQWNQKHQVWWLHRNMSPRLSTACWHCVKPVSPRMGAAYGSEEGMNSPRNLLRTAKGPMAHTVHVLLALKHAKPRTHRTGANLRTQQQDLTFMRRSL